MNDYLLRTMLMCLSVYCIHRIKREEMYSRFIRKMRMYDMSTILMPLHMNALFFLRDKVYIFTTIYNTLLCQFKQSGTQGLPPFLKVHVQVDITPRYIHNELGDKSSPVKSNLN